MKRLFIYILTLVTVLASCDETTDTIGTSLTDGTDKLNITTATYWASTESAVMGSVISRSTTGYLGKVKDPETGTNITCNLMSQLHSYKNAFPQESQIVSRNEAGEVIADSCTMYVLYYSFYGDSLAVMKCTLREMETCMEESNQYYTSYSPKDYGLIRKDGINVSRTYTLADLTLPESERLNSKNIPSLRFNMNDAYTDKDNKSYNNYGTYLMKKFYENPVDFSNTWSFTHHVCPGFYLESTNGIGAMMYVYVTQLVVYFRYKDASDGTIYNGIANFSGTEEALQNTDIKQDSEQIKKLTDDNSCTYLKTPAGIYTRIVLPVDEVMQDPGTVSSSKYTLRQDTLNTARLSIKRINNDDIGGNTMPIPTSLLVIPDTLMKDFFANNKVCDYRTSLIVSYDSSTNGYVMDNLSSIFNYMAQTKAEYLNEHPGISSKQYNEMFPNWNKICLVPVTYSTTTVNSSSVLTRVVNDMSLTSTRLEGGKNNPNCIKVSVIYSKFSK